MNAEEINKQMKTTPREIVIGERSVGGNNLETLIGKTVIKTVHCTKVHRMMRIEKIN